MVYRVEILTDIEFSEPLITLCVLLCPFQGLISALTYATGITVEDLKIVEHRVTDAHHGMESHPFRKRGGTDSSASRVIDREEMILPESERAIE